MDWASRLILSLKMHGEAVFLSNSKVQFWISVIWQVFSYCKMKKVSTGFSVKSSWEIHWTIMFQKDVVCHRQYVWTNLNVSVNAVIISENFLKANHKNLILSHSAWRFSDNKSKKIKMSDFDVTDFLVKIAHSAKSK